MQALAGQQRSDGLDLISSSASHSAKVPIPEFVTSSHTSQVKHQPRRGSNKKQSRLPVVAGLQRMNKGGLQMINSSASHLVGVPIVQFVTGNMAHHQHGCDNDKKQPWMLASNGAKIGGVGND